ncbi:AbiJ-NTD4 domain-containing protein [Marinifilum fragile]|uniref:AbiJ-NTD4 domain-containing protein n=1 Tax=Marinifilum fragile TaxID=570161 RepID=UPI002AA897F4|nr:hypothetical protein [Marinifilum fragile]
MRFSQRTGIMPATKELQLESIDEDLRNCLWNVFCSEFLEKLSTLVISSTPSEFRKYSIRLWDSLYKLPIDEIPSNIKSTKSFIREKFFKCEWYRIYDLLEFSIGLKIGFKQISPNKFIAKCNHILKREFSGYRFINNQISPISNANEINEIEKAIKQADSFTPLQGANTHLKSALNKLSDRKNPDYRNSIKESVSAIEVVAKIISGSKKDSLGKALVKIKTKINIHPALERGFNSLYSYTSDGDGIRHGLMDEDNCDFEDAKYMLVSSSAFINYLIVKGQKAGVEF